MSMAISVAPPSEKMAFQPAIEIPNNDHCTWSQRTSGHFHDVFERQAAGRRAGREALEDPGLDASMVDADRAGNGNRGRRKQRESAGARGSGGVREGQGGEQDRGGVRPALPVAHLARVKPAEILRAERAAEKPERKQQRDQPRCRGIPESQHSAPLGQRRFAHCYDFLGVLAAATFVPRVPSRFSVRSA